MEGRPEHKPKPEHVAHMEQSRSKAGTELLPWFLAHHLLPRATPYLLLSRTRHKKRSGAASVSGSPLLLVAAYQLLPYLDTRVTISIYIFLSNTISTKSHVRLVQTTNQVVLHHFGQEALASLGLASGPEMALVVLPNTL